MSRPVSDPVLIVSTGRTGTRFIANLLDRYYPGVEAHHTTPRSTVINVLGNLHLCRLLSERSLLYAWRVLKGGTFAVTDRDVFVDSNNHLYVFAAYAHRLYHDAKVVHVVRDPRSYVRSHLNWARERPKSFVANHLLPFWQPNAFLLGEIGPLRWLRMDRFERFCWVWDFKNRFLARLGQTSRPYLLLRFEDLIADETRRRTLERLAGFIGADRASGEIDLSDIPRNDTGVRRFPAWREWSDARCRQLDRLCGEQMSLYGYGRESDWRSRIRRPA